MQQIHTVKSLLFIDFVDQFNNKLSSTNVNYYYEMYHKHYLPKKISDSTV